MMQESPVLSKRIKGMIILGFRQFWDPYYQGFAAQVAFFIMLSFVPTVILVSQLMSLLNVDMLDMDYIIEKMADPSVGRLLRRLLSTRLTFGKNVLLILTAVWAASRVQFALMRISNYLYSNGRTTGYYVIERARSLKNMSLTVIIFAFVGVILVNGPVIIGLLFGNILEGTLIESAWIYARWPITGAMYFLLVLHNYWMLPNYKLKIKKLKPKDVLPGSLFAAVGMLLVTIVYSTYVNSTGGHMNAIYGSLASMVALMFWFYLLSWVMILGMLFNKVWMDTKDPDVVDVGR